MIAFDQTISRRTRIRVADVNAGAQFAFFIVSAIGVGFAQSAFFNAGLVGLVHFSQRRTQFDRVGGLK